MEVEPIQRVSSAHAVANAVRRWIVLGIVAPGDRLPPERDLAEMFGVGRVTLRHAIRVLSQQGLVHTTRGRAGGTLVADGSGARSRVALSKQILDEVRENFEFRLRVEPFAAKLCAERATSAERLSIRALCDEQATSMRGWRALDSRFHLAVASSSRNKLLIDAVRRSREEFFFWADAVFAGAAWERLPAEERDFGAKHRTVAEAIIQSDPRSAEVAMADHLERGAEMFGQAFASALKVQRHRRRSKARRQPEGSSNSDNATAE